METEHELWTDVVDEEGFVGTIVAIGVDGLDDPDGPYGATYKLKAHDAERTVRAGLCADLQREEALTEIAFTTSVQMTAIVDMRTGVVSRLRLLMPMTMDRRDFDPDFYDGNRAPTELELRLANEVITVGEWLPITDTGRIEFES